MSMKKTLLSTVLAFTLLPAAAMARDTVLHLNFNSAVERATRDGVLDGSVRFRLAGGGGVPANVVRRGEVVTNKKPMPLAKVMRKPVIMSCVQP